MLINVIPTTYLQYADHTDITHLSKRPEKRKEKERNEKKKAVPRAAAAYGRQLKNGHGGRWVVKKEQNYAHMVIE